MHNIDIKFELHLESTATYNLVMSSGVPGTIHPFLAPHVKAKRGHIRPNETSYWTLSSQRWTGEDTSSVETRCLSSAPHHIGVLVLRKFTRRIRFTIEPTLWCDSSSSEYAIQC